MQKMISKSKKYGETDEKKEIIDVEVEIEYLRDHVTMTPSAPVKEYAFIFQ